MILKHVLLCQIFLPVIFGVILCILGILHRAFIKMASFVATEKALQTIINSERSYVADLELCLLRFVRPIMASMQVCKF